MAHKSNGYIYTDDAVPSLICNGVITFYNRLERYQEQAATLVMHGGKKHERVFTESEVRAMAADMIAVAVSEANTVYPSEQHAEKGVIHAMRETIERHGVSLDPA